MGPRVDELEVAGVDELEDADVDELDVADVAELELDVADVAEFEVDDSPVLESAAVRELELIVLAAVGFLDARWVRFSALNCRS